KYLTSVSTPWSIGVASHGSYVFVTDKYRGLDIYYYDAEKNQLQHISNFHHSSGVQYRFIEVQGCYAYISCKYGLEVVDISDLANPQHEIYISKGSLNKDLAVSGNWVFVSGAYQGVHLFDFKDYFASGGSVHQYTLTYSPSHGSRNSYDVAVDGELLYVADYYNGLEIFDWQEFLSGGTYWLGECYNGIKGNPTGVAVDGDWAYITTFTDGGFLFVVDVTTPSFDMTPYAAYKNSDGGMDPVPYGNWVAFVSGRWYPHSTFRIEMVARTLTEIEPSWIEHKRLDDVSSMLGGWVAIEGNYVYVIGMEPPTIVQKYSIADPTDITWVDEFSIYAAAIRGWSVEALGGILYINSSSGIITLRANDLHLLYADLDNSWTVRGRIRVEDWFHYVILTGIGHFIPSEDEDRLIHAVYDVSDPENVVFLDSLHGEDTAPAYQGPEGLYYFGHTFESHRVLGDLDCIYVNNSLGVRSREWVADVDFIAEHPDSFITFSYFNTSPNSFDRDHRIMGKYDKGVWGSSWTDGNELVFDASSQFHSPGSDGGIFSRKYYPWGCEDWYFYAASGSDWEGVRTHFLDADEVGNMYVAVWNDHPGYTGERKGLWYMKYQIGDFITCGYVLDDSELRIDPDGEPGWGDFLDLNIIHFAMRGDKLCLLSKPTGVDEYYLDVVQVMEYLSGGAMAKGKTSGEEPSKPVMVCEVKPNPFNAVTQIAFNLSEAAEVGIEIFNTYGEKVEEIPNTRYEAGYHELKWDANDLPSGLYFIRTKAKDSAQTKKVVLLK
ncbi:hypothetical protein DRQ19_03320, partial [bacterium]